MSSTESSNTLFNAFRATLTHPKNEALLSLECIAVTQYSIACNLNNLGYQIECSIISNNETFIKTTSKNLYFSQQQLYSDTNFAESILIQLHSICMSLVGEENCSYLTLQWNAAYEQIKYYFTNILRTLPTHSRPLNSGWYSNNNLIQYTQPINFHTRQLIQYDFYNYLQTYNQQNLHSYHQNVAPINMLYHFAHIKNYDARRFMFLYVHYCYMASLFASITKNSVLIIDTPSNLKEHLLPFLFGYPQNLCELLSVYSKSTDIKSLYDETKDIPFIIDINPKFTATKAEAVIDSILTEEAPFSAPMVIHKSVPVIFSNNHSGFDDCYHIEISSNDIELPLNSFGHSFNIVRYFELLAKTFGENSSIYNYFPSNLATNIYSLFFQNKQKSDLNNEPILYAIFRTINEILQQFFSPYANQTPEDSNLYREYFEENIDSFLKRYLPGLKPAHSFQISSFYDTLKTLIANNELEIFSRNSTSLTTCVPKDVFQNRPCLLSTYDRWALNTAGLELIRSHMPEYLSVTTLLRQLSANHVLTFSRANDKTYKNKIRIRYRSGEMDDQYLYEIFPRGNILLSEDKEYTFDAVKEHRHFLLGIHSDTNTPMYWNFDDDANMNRHMLITGQSGAGKSCFLQNLIMQAAEQKITTVVFHHQGSSIVGKNIVRIDINNERPNIRCFMKGEKSIAAVAEHLAVALQLNHEQQNIVYEAYAEYLNQKNNTDTAQKNCINAKTPPSIQEFIYHVLQKEDPLPGITSSIRRQFRILFGSDTFSTTPLDWEKYEGKVLVLDFSGNNTDDAWYKCYSEIYLYDLYNHQIKHTEGIEPKPPLIIISDEYQNMNTKRTSMLDKILREGRKHGCALWLASQLLENTTTSRLNNISRQAALKIYFQQGSERSKAVANKMYTSSAERTHLQEAMASLKQRQFIFKLNEKRPHKCTTPDLSDISL